MLANHGAGDNKGGKKAGRMTNYLPIGVSLVVQDHCLQHSSSGIGSKRAFFGLHGK